MKTTDLFRKDYEKRVVASSRKPSQFVPGMAFELKDIILKHAVGIAPDVQQKGQYSENPDFDDITIRPDMDLTDIAELQARLNWVREQQKYELNKKQKAEEDKKFNDEVEKRLAEKLKNAEPVKPE